MALSPVELTFLSVALLIFGCCGSVTLGLVALIFWLIRRRSKSTAADEADPEGGDAEGNDAVVAPAALPDGLDAPAGDMAEPDAAPMALGLAAETEEVPLTASPKAEPSTAAAALEEAATDQGSSGLPEFSASPTPLDLPVFSESDEDPTVLADLDELRGVRGGAKRDADGDGGGLDSLTSLPASGERAEAPPEPDAAPPPAPAVELPPSPAVELPPPPAVAERTPAPPAAELPEFPDEPAPQVDPAPSSPESPPPAAALPPLGQEGLDPSAVPPDLLRHGATIVPDDIGMDPETMLTEEHVVATGASAAADDETSED